MVLYKEVAPLSFGALKEASASIMWNEVTETIRPSGGIEFFVNVFNNDKDNAEIVAGLIDIYATIEAYDPMTQEFDTLLVTECVIGVDNIGDEAAEMVNNDTASMVLTEAYYEFTLSDEFDEFDE